jgi:hypothetical protein
MLENGMGAAKHKAKRPARKIVWTGNRQHMRHSDFWIGREFLTEGGRWRCTDVGTRTIAAIKLDKDHDPGWYNGPPYAVLESVFDEYSIEGCEPAPKRRTYDDSGRSQIVSVRVKRRRAKSDTRVKSVNSRG